MLRRKSHVRVEGGRGLSSELLYGGAVGGQRFGVGRGRGEGVQGGGVGGGVSDPRFYIAPLPLSLYYGGDHCESNRICTCYLWGNNLIRADEDVPDKTACAAACANTSTCLNAVYFANSDKCWLLAGCATKVSVW